MELSRDELERYSRHIILPNIGLEGQQKLKSSAVLLVGAGGLGSPLAMYLAAAGVGRLGIVDFDVVDVSNLQRQVLHGTSDVGRSKLASAADRLREINPFIELELHEEALTSENALSIIPNYDLVADGTDNFATRYLVNDACVISGVPNVYGSIFRFEGQVSVFGAAEGPCYRCIYPEPPPPGLVPSCAEGGVLGVLPGLVGTMQATEVVKLLLEIGEPLIGRLLLVDALSMAFRELKVPRDPDCPVCGDSPTQTTLIDYEAFCNGVGDLPKEEMIVEMSVQEFNNRRQAGTAPYLLDVREPFEWQLASMGADKEISLKELEGRVEELNDWRNKELVVHCKSGGRSAKAVKLLQAAGFTKVINLAGGVDAWNKEGLGGV